MLAWFKAPRITLNPAHVQRYARFFFAQDVDNPRLSGTRNRRYRQSGRSETTRNGVMGRAIVVLMSVVFIAGLILVACWPYVRMAFASSAHDSGLDSNDSYRNRGSGRAERGDYAHSPARSALPERNPESAVL